MTEDDEPAADQQSDAGEGLEEEVVQRSEIHGVSFIGRRRLRAPHVGRRRCAACSVGMILDEKPDAANNPT